MTRKKEWTVVDDCRPIFPPLTECCDDSAAAIHVVETNWSNDDLIDLPTLAKEGLRIRCDGPLDPASLTNDTFLVYIDAPLGQMGAALLQHRVYVPGVVARDPSDPAVAVWGLRPRARRALHFVVRRDGRTADGCHLVEEPASAT